MIGNTRQPCDEAVVHLQPDVKDCGQATGRWVLAAAILGSSITFVDGTVVNVALPLLQRELGASVAPLTTTVMSALEERHVGVASGINNVVSRIAALLAVAVFGVFMLNAFDKNLAERLYDMRVSSEVQEQLVGQSGDFVSIKIPNNVSEEVQMNIRQAIKESFVSGFRIVAYLAAALAVASAVVSWVLIRGPS
jgi:hypothetical protein